MALSDKNQGLFPTSVLDDDESFGLVLEDTRVMSKLGYSKAVALEYEQDWPLTTESRMDERSFVSPWMNGVASLLLTMFQNVEDNYSGASVFMNLMKCGMDLECLAEKTGSADIERFVVDAAEVAALAQTMHSKLPMYMSFFFADLVKSWDDAKRLSTDYRNFGEHEAALCVDMTGDNGGGLRIQVANALMDRVEQCCIKSGRPVIARVDVGSWQTGELHSVGLVVTRATQSKLRNTLKDLLGKLETKHRIKILFTYATRPNLVAEKNKLRERLRLIFAKIAAADTATAADMTLRNNMLAADKLLDSAIEEREALDEQRDAWRQIRFDVVDSNGPALQQNYVDNNLALLGLSKWFRERVAPKLAIPMDAEELDHHLSRVLRVTETCSLQRNMIDPLWGTCIPWTWMSFQVMMAHKYVNNADDMAVFTRRLDESNVNTSYLLMAYMQRSLNLMSYADCGVHYDIVNKTLYANPRMRQVPCAEFRAKDAAKCTQCRLLAVSTKAVARVMEKHTIMKWDTTDPLFSRPHFTYSPPTDGFGDARTNAFESFSLCIGFMSAPYKFDEVKQSFERNSSNSTLLLHVSNAVHDDMRAKAQKSRKMAKGKKDYFSIYEFDIHSLNRFGKCMHEYIPLLRYVCFLARCTQLTRETDVCCIQTNPTGPGSYKGIYLGKDVRNTARTAAGSGAFALHAK